MMRRLAWYVFALFAVFFCYDLAVWGAVESLPDVGPQIAASARAQAPIASTYMFLGEAVDGWLPALQSFGSSQLVDAWQPAFDRIGDDASVAMDVLSTNTFNATHRWIKFAYWMAPLLLVAGVLMVAFRPRRVHLIGRR